MIPLENSISALAQVGVRETGATGYAIFLQNPSVQISGTGESIAPETLTDRLLTFPLHPNDGPDGLLAFLFKDATAAARAEARLTTPG